jgi:hypothetical protein
VGVVVFVYDVTRLLTRWWVWLYVCTMLRDSGHCRECGCLCVRCYATADTVVSVVVFVYDVTRLLTL